MAASTLNFNVGVLGHIDSGKTSLAKALSSVESTACFDKNPQSQERGITIDLGFSSFTVPMPSGIGEGRYDSLQFTLVDCPGHASLIKTIIGGAQIIDLMMLVVDITKGIQTQTAECLVIGEITCPKMMVVLNKIDLVPADKRSSTVDKMSKRLRKTLENTKFAEAPIIPVAATDSVGIDELISKLTEFTFIPKRDPSGPFIFSVDHCFSIRGQGTVMTGTVLSGSVTVNDTVEITNLKESRKVKSIQMFKKPVQKAIQGDRAGICVTQFDPKLLERGLVCSPGALSTIYAAIVSLNKISYYKNTISTNAKYHVTIGHETVMAKIRLFGSEMEGSFDLGMEYLHLEQIPDESNPGIKATFALMEFEHPVTAPHGSLVIGSRLDTNINLNTCRIAFQGKLLHVMKDKGYVESELPLLKVYKFKSKEGVVERVTNEYEVICKSIFKKESNIQNFVGLKVDLSTGEKGVIEGSFGQSGKIKVRIPNGLQESTVKLFSDKKKKVEGGASTEVVKISLKFKRYVYDLQKKMVQS